MPEFIAAGCESTILDVYPWSTATGFGARLSNPVSMPSSLPYGVHINSTASLIAATDESSAGQNVYPLTSVIGTRFAKPIGLNTTEFDIQFNPASTQIAASGSYSPYIHAWPWSSGFGGKYSNPSPIPSQYVKNIQFSPNGNFLAANLNTGRAPIAYAWTASGFSTRYTAASTSLPSGTTQYGLDFSPSSNAVAVGHSRSPYATIYPFSGSGFGTKYSNPGTLPGIFGDDLIWCIKFSPDGAYVAMGASSSPFVYIYSWSVSGWGTKLSNPSVMPNIYPSSCSWASDSASVAFNAADSYDMPNPLYVYQFSGSFGVRYSNPVVAPIGGGGDLAFGLQSAAAAFTLTASVSSFTLTRNSANLIKGRSISANVANISCSGQNVLLNKTTIAVASVGQTRIAYMALKNVDANGNYVDKNTASLSDILSSRLELIILPNSANASTQGYPTLKSYLALEAAQGYVLSHMTQSQIITTNMN